MQNKFLYQILCVGFIALAVQPALAQDADDFLAPVEEEPAIATPAVEPDPMELPAFDVPAVEQPVQNITVTAEPASDVTPDLTGKQAVDFPGRTSLDTLELAPLPGIYETNITGPAPMAPSVSAKDMPSERLLGRLTPEVFQEMAELERDNTFLKLQIQKETMKNDLEKLRANYRQARLDEIAKREDVVRTRIQWWQEQEKIRQDLEAQRAASEAQKAAEDESALLDAPPATDEEGNPLEDAKPTETAEAPPAPEPVAPVYALVGISGTRGLLNAQIKNTETGRVSRIQKGDTLTDGSTVDEITPSQVILRKNGAQKALTFEDV